jgi:hypothetical protein
MGTKKDSTKVAFEPAVGMDDSADRTAFKSSKVADSIASGWTGVPGARIEYRIAQAAIKRLTHGIIQAAGERLWNERFRRAKAVSHNPQEFTCASIAAFSPRASPPE